MDNDQLKYEIDVLADYSFASKMIFCFLPCLTYFMMWIGLLYYMLN